jgi:hypothetical protein
MFLGTYSAYFYQVPTDDVESGLQGSHNNLPPTYHLPADYRSVIGSWKHCPGYFTGRLRCVWSPGCYVPSRGYGIIPCHSCSSLINVLIDFAGSQTGTSSDILHKCVLGPWLWIV